MKKLDCGTSSSRMWTGLVVLGIGVVFLLKNIGVNIPGWLMNWHILLVPLGLLIGYKLNYRGFTWIIMIILGVVFMAEDIFIRDLSHYYFAVIFMVLGIYLIVRPKGASRFKNRWRRKMRYAAPESAGKLDDSGGFVYRDKVDNDILDSVDIFGGSHQKIYSKNFKGGDAVAIFGGSDLNFTQADFEGQITLDVVAIFGGLKIIIPPDWEVKSEVTTIFGGIDDKRSVGPINPGSGKLLIINGVALFGGVDIRNF